MKLFPDARLVALLAATAAGALLGALWPPLLAPLLAAFLLLVAAVTVDAAALARRAPARAARSLPRRAAVGRETEVTLRVEHDGDRTIEVTVVDEVPLDLRSADPRFPGVRVPPRGSAERSYVVRPTVRGDRELGALFVLERGPLGLLCRRVAGGGERALRVYSDTGRLVSREALDPKRLLSALGVKP